MACADASVRREVASAAVTGPRRLSQAISEGDGISILVEVTDAAAARSAEQQGAEGIVVRAPAGGVANVLTGLRDELAPVLAGHMDVNAIDVTGADGSTAELERLAADNVKRVVHARDEQSPWEIASFLELKTVWHPVGA